MYVETVRQPERASDRGALVAHLLSHLSRSARAMRVATQLSSALGTTAMSLTMSRVLPVLRDEQEMLRALLLTLADRTGSNWPTVESRRVRELVDAPVPPVAPADPIGTAQPYGAMADHGSPLSGRTFDALLDAMIEGCWGRLALWRVLSERSRLTSPHEAIDFASLARRSEAMIGELESMQGSGVASN